MAGARPGCDRGFGPARSWRGYHEVVDHFAHREPRALAVEDAEGAWTYAELRDASLRVAALLTGRGLAGAAPRWAERPQAPQPVAVWAQRGREFVAVCLGLWRLGLPVVALSRDMADTAMERSRNAQAMRDLKPLAIVSNDGAADLAAVDGAPNDLVVVTLAEVAAAIRGEGPGAVASSPVSPESALAYVYTGGTTKASKCVAVTHSMALWEAESYSVALQGRAGPGDKMLQYSSLYWGAAVFGQISIGFAVGACVCIGGCPRGCGGAGDALRQLAVDTEAFGITVLGVVPSQLRGAWPDGPASAHARIHTLVVWADKCPPELSRRWTTRRRQVIDLLIASEYWLALHSDCRTWSDGAVEKHIYRALPGLDVRFLVEVTNGTTHFRDALPGEVGEMHLAGPTTSPGYICPDGHVGLDFHDAERIVDGKAYLRTRDQLLLLKDGGLVYSGRADSMMKHGGQWVDADALQDAVTAVPGVVQAAVLPGAQGIDAFVVLQSGGLAPFRVLAAVRRALPASTPGGCRIHLRVDMPLNPATAKIDRKALAAELEGLRDEVRRHCERHDAFEGSMLRHCWAWGRVAAGVIVLPQLVPLAAGGALRIRSAPHLAAQAAGFFGLSVFRLVATSELWMAATFLEDRWKATALGKQLSSLSYRVGLPTEWSKCAPLLPAALLPAPRLAWLVGMASASLAESREGDRFLAFGLGGAMCAALSRPALFGRLPRSAVVGALAVGSALLRWPSTKELVACLAAAPGLCLQVLPKYLGEAFASRCRGELRQPMWSQEIVFDSRSAVVDEGNTWEVVELTSCSGGSPWSSIGVRVLLPEAMKAEGSPLARFLETGSAPPSAGSGALGTPQGTTSGESGTVASLTALVERICGGQGADALHGLDSMQAIQLTEAIHRQFHRPLSVADVLRCTEVDELAQAIEARAAGPEDGAEEPALQRPRSEREPLRVWLCGMGPAMCTVDWLVTRADHTRHLDIEALQRAVDRLVSRHAALRARNATDCPAFDPTYSAASLWQLWCASGAWWTRGCFGRRLSSSIFQAWPRTRVLSPTDPRARVKLLRPTVGEVLCEGYEASEDQRAFWAGTAAYAKGAPEALFRVCAVPVFQGAGGAEPSSHAVEAALVRPASEVKWYIYALLEHGYCDGPTGAPLYADLLQLYGEESGEAPATSRPARRPMEALEVLEARLRRSLKPLPEGRHPNEDIYHDGLVGFGSRPGFQRHIRMEESLMKVLRGAAQEVLGCSVDVAWLTVIAGAYLRLFPSLRRVDLYLAVTCRDGPGEEAMIGFFTSVKIMALKVGDPRRATVLGLADLIASVRRQRAWRRPRPFEKNDAIEVNIVSQAADGLPLGFREVRCSRGPPRSWNRGATANMNLRLDQTGRDAWDFRLQSHDASWGEGWSNYYAQAMGSMIVDMALRPNDAVVPRAG